MKKYLKIIRISIVVLADLFAIPIAWYSAYWLRFNLRDIPSLELRHATYLLPLLLFTQGAVFWAFKLYRGMWSFASMPDLIRILKAVAFGIGLVLVGLFFVPFKIPRSIIPIYAWLLVSLLGGTRFVYRWIKNYSRSSHKEGKRTLVVGAGHAADLLLRELRKGTSAEAYNIVVIYPLHLKKPVFDNLKIVFNSGSHIVFYKLPLFFKKIHYCISELLNRSKKLIISCAFIHHLPNPLNGVQIWAVGRQMMKCNAMFSSGILSAGACIV